MTVVSSTQDPAARSLTLVSEFDAPVDRVWQVWADPRQLERWWGPPGFPATVTEHELSPGGRVSYHMTAPDGTEYPGWWVVKVVDPPHRLVTEDGFSDEHGEPDEDMPVSTLSVTRSSVWKPTMSEPSSPSMSSRRQGRRWNSSGGGNGMWRKKPIVTSLRCSRSIRGTSWSW